MRYVSSRLSIRQPNQASTANVPIITSMYYNTSTVYDEFNAWIRLVKTASFVQQHWTDHAHWCDSQKAIIKPLTVCWPWPSVGLIYVRLTRPWWTYIKVAHSQHLPHSQKQIYNTLMNFLFKFSFQINWNVNNFLELYAGKLVAYAWIYNSHILA